MKSWDGRQRAGGQRNGEESRRGQRNRRTGLTLGYRHVRQEARVLPLDTEDGVVDFCLRGGGAFGFLVHGMADGCKSCARS